MCTYFMVLFYKKCDVLTFKVFVILGTLIGLRVLNKYLGMEDLSILMIAFMDTIITHIILTTTSTEFALYVGKYSLDINYQFSKKYRAIHW